MIAGGSGSVPCRPAYRSLSDRKAAGSCHLSILYTARIRGPLYERLNTFLTSRGQGPAYGTQQDLIGRLNGMATSVFIVPDRVQPGEYDRIMLTV
jgi:hypothetical protein